MGTPRRRLVRARRGARALLVLFLVVGAVLVGLLGTGRPALASINQHGVGQIVLNPGGGNSLDASDGLRVVLNSTATANSGSGTTASNASDQLWFANTVQFCCGGVGPNLNIGGDLYGENGAAASRPEHSWSSLTLVGTTGAAVVGTTLPSTTGSATAQLRYTAVKGGLTYTMDRTVSYTFPNDYYRDTYTFTIPSGNTDVVRFYKGGDTAPGSDDHGYGIQLTSPVRSVISLNPSSHILVGQREVPGDKPFDGATAETYDAPYDAVADGSDIGFQTDTASHDAGFMTQWNLGSTPGTQTYAQETFVDFQGATLTAGFRTETVADGSPVLLDLNVVNTALSSRTGLGYTFTLPAGLVVAAGTPTNACGGILTAAPAGGTITLSGGNVSSAGNCLTSVPVVAAGIGSYAIGGSSVSGLAALTDGVGSSTLTVTSAPPPAAPQPPAPQPTPPPGAPTGLVATPGRSSVLVRWHAPATGQPVVRYRVTASPGSATCTTTALSCVLGGVAGQTYTITVTPLAAGDAAGTPASVVTSVAVTPPVVASEPPADAPLELTTDRGRITSAEPGERITVIGTGFLPFSTVSIAVYSTPVPLGQVTTDANGGFSRSVVVPTDLAAGKHSLVAYGVDPAGNPQSLRLNVTVARDGATSPPSRLAFTGLTVPPLTYLPLALMLIAGGVVLLFAAGTRRRAAPAEGAPVDRSPHGRRPGAHR